MQQQGHHQQGASSSSSREISPSCSPGTGGGMTALNAPRYGTTVPNRIFVGGITTDTTEQELQVLFSRFGKVSAVKIINDRAGVPRGYGFVTFETDEEAKRVLREGDNLVLKGRKLNVAIAIKKQQVGGGGRGIESSHFVPNGTMMFQPTHPNGIAFPTYATHLSDASAHFYSPEAALYHFAAAAAGAHHGSGANQAQTATSPGGQPGGPPTYPFLYQQPFYFAQPPPHQQHQQTSPASGYPSHHHHFQQAPVHHHGHHGGGGGAPGAAMAGAPWPQYLMPQVMVNSHLNHVS